MPETFSKFAVFTGFGEGLSIAHHLRMEGNDVLVGMVTDLRDVMEKDEEAPDSKALRWKQYQGMLDKQDAWALLEQMREFENKDEWCLIFDFNTLWQFADEARKMGFTKGLFPMRIDWQLEADRDFAKRFVLKNYPNLKVAEVEEFKSVEDAAAFLGESDEFWALKGNDAAAKTVVPRTSILEHAKFDLLDALHSDRQVFERKGFILERQIRDGYEVCPEMVFMDGKRVASNIDLEDKAYSHTNSASLEGCAINAIVETELDCQLNDWAFPSATDKLAKKHTGLYYIDANLIIKDGEAYYLEFCSGRLGYDAAVTEMEMSGGASNYFNAILNGEIPYESKYGLSTRGFMTKREDEGHLKEGLTIQSESQDHLWFFTVQKDGNKLLNTGGAFGDAVHGIDLVAITAASDDAIYAGIKLEEQVDSISFQGLHARRDAGSLLCRIDGLEKLLAPAVEGD